MKNVVLTGASGGIGSEILKRLDTLGYRVFAGVRSKSDIMSLRQSYSERVVPIMLDITNQQQITLASEEIDRLVGNVGVQGLINNAGLIVEGPTELVSIELLRQQFEVNVIGQIALTQAILPMLRNGAGRIINMGAITGKVCVPFLGPIAASKSALETLTDALRMELSPWQISVIIIEAGAIDTAIFSKSHAVADAHLLSLNQSKRRLYQETLVRARAALDKAAPDKVSVVVDAVKQALTDKNPKTRYIVGKGAAQLMMLRHLPDKIRDALFIGQMGISKPLSDDKHWN